MMNRILLVDDLNFVKILLKQILEKNGYVVCGDASDGLEGIEKFKELKPDLVILDIIMPKLDGVAALREMISIDPAAKIIICSSLGHENVIMDAIKAGAREFIVKPFDNERLLSAVKHTLEMD
jgi:two-component system chemotaxis response regulator CheY